MYFIALIGKCFTVSFLLGLVLFGIYFWDVIVLFLDTCLLSPCLTPPCIYINLFSGGGALLPVGGEGVRKGHTKSASISAASGTRHSDLAPSMTTSHPHPSASAHDTNLDATAALKRLVNTLQLHPSSWVCLLRVLLDFVSIVMLQV